MFRNKRKDDMNEATRRFIEHYEKLVKQGDPLAWEARALARNYAARQFTGEALDSPLADDSIQDIANGILREPETVKLPNGRLVKVKKVTLSAEVVDGIEISPEREVSKWVMLSGPKLSCPQCSHHSETQELQGWELDTQPGDPKYIVRCPNCFTYHFIGVRPNSGTGQAPLK